jgi:hypothetical protein
MSDQVFVSTKKNIREDWPTLLVSRSENVTKFFKLGRKKHRGTCTNPLTIAEFTASSCDIIDDIHINADTNAIGFEIRFANDSKKVWDSMFQPHRSFKISEMRSITLLPFLHKKTKIYLEARNDPDGWKRGVYIEYRKIWLDPIVRESFLMRANKNFSIPQYGPQARVEDESVLFCACMTCEEYKKLEQCKFNNFDLKDLENLPNIVQSDTSGLRAMSEQKIQASIPVDSSSSPAKLEQQIPHGSETFKTQRFAFGSRSSVHFLFPKNCDVVHSISVKSDDCVSCSILFMPSNDVDDCKFPFAHRISDSQDLLSFKLFQMIHPANDVYISLSRKHSAAKWVKIEYTVERFEDGILRRNYLDMKRWRMPGYCSNGSAIVANDHILMETLREKEEENEYVEEKSVGIEKETIPQKDSSMHCKFRLLEYYEEVLTPSEVILQQLREKEIARISAKLQEVQLDLSQQMKAIVAKNFVFQ